MFRSGSVAADIGWCQFCDKHAGGCRDPQLMDLQRVAMFLLSVDQPPSMKNKNPLAAGLDEDGVLHDRGKGRGKDPWTEQGNGHENRAGEERTASGEHAIGSDAMQCMRHGPSPMDAAHEKRQRAPRRRRQAGGRRRADSSQPRTEQWNGHQSRAGEERSAPAKDARVSQAQGAATQSTCHGPSPIDAAHDKHQRAQGLVHSGAQDSAPGPRLAIDDRAATDDRVEGRDLQEVGSAAAVRSRSRSAENSGECNRIGAQSTGDTASEAPVGFLMALRAHSSGTLPKRPLGVRGIAWDRISVKHQAGGVEVKDGPPGQPEPSPCVEVKHGPPGQPKPSPCQAAERDGTAEAGECPDSVECSAKEDMTDPQSAEGGLTAAAISKMLEDCLLNDLTDFDEPSSEDGTRQTCSKPAALTRQDGPAVMPPGPASAVPQGSCQAENAGAPPSVTPQRPVPGSSGVGVATNSRGLIPQRMGRPKVKVHLLEQPELSSDGARTQPASSAAATQPDESPATPTAASVPAQQGAC